MIIAITLMIDEGYQQLYHLNEIQQSMICHFCLRKLARGAHATTITAANVENFPQ